MSSSLIGLDRVQERDTAAGDDALLERRAGRLDGVLDTVLLLLHLGLGCRADLDHSDAAGQLREPLLELLAIEVGAATETEMKKKKHRVEDAVQATRAHIEKAVPSPAAVSRS